MFNIVIIINIKETGKFMHSLGNFFPNNLDSKFSLTINFREIIKHYLVV